MENQILFYRVILFPAALVCGIITGLLQVWLVKGLNFRSYVYAATIGFLIGNLLVWVATGISIKFSSYYEGFFMNWGAIYLNFVLKVSVFYIANMCTLWLATKKTKK